MIPATSSTPNKDPTMRAAPPGRTVPRLTAAVAFLSLVPATPAQFLAKAPISSPPSAGYHLSVPFYTSPVLVLEDLAGRTAHVWSTPSLGWQFSSMAKPLSSGHVLTELTHQLQQRKRIVELSWRGDVVWEYEPPANRRLHHEFTRLANGDTLLVTSELESLPSLASVPVLDDIVTVVTPRGQTVWEWSSAAHYKEMPITRNGWKSLVPRGATEATLFHLNSADILPPNRWEATDPRFAAGNVLASFRELNLVVIIDRATGAIVWTMHNVTIGQHHVRMLDEDLDGAGHLLLFDNGGTGGAPPLPYRPYSRALEIDPTTQDIVWSYGDAPGEELFSPIMGSVQRLPNGNTLITAATSGRSFEITQTGNVVWERNNGRTYRAYRAPLGWPTGVIRAFRW